MTAFPQDNRTLPSPSDEDEIISARMAEMFDSPLVKKLISLYERSFQARWAMISQVITSGANFATTVILVRVLGLEDFGRFSICFLLIMIVRNFLTGAVLLPMSTVGPKLRKISVPAYKGFLAVNLLVFGLGSSLLLVALALPLGWLIDAPWLPGAALPLALANLTSVASDYIRRFHFVYERSAIACAVDVVRYAIQLGLLGALAIWWAEGMSAASALYALAAGALAGAVLGALFCGRVAWSNRLSRIVWLRHWNFIKWLTPSVIFEAVQSNGVMLIAAAIMSESAFGAVRAMQNLSNTINLPVNALQNVAPSLSSRVFTRGGYPALRSVLAKITIASLVLVVALGASIIALSGYVIPLVFKVEAADSFALLIAFCILNVLITIRFPFMVTLQVLEIPRALTFGNSVSAIAGILLVAPCIQYFGDLGAPLVRILILAISTTLFAVLLRSNLKISAVRSTEGA